MIVAKNIDPLPIHLDKVEVKSTKKNSVEEANSTILAEAKFGPSQGKWLGTAGMEVAYNTLGEITAKLGLDIGKSTSSRAGIINFKIGPIPLSFKFDMGADVGLPSIVYEKIPQDSIFDYVLGASHEVEKRTKSFTNYHQFGAINEHDQEGLCHLLTRLLDNNIISLELVLELFKKLSEVKINDKKIVMIASQSTVIQKFLAPFPHYNEKGPSNIFNDFLFSLSSSEEEIEKSHPEIIVKVEYCPSEGNYLGTGGVKMAYNAVSSNISKLVDIGEYKSSRAGIISFTIGELSIGELKFDIGPGESSFYEAASGYFPGASREDQMRKAAAEDYKNYGAITKGSQNQLTSTLQDLLEKKLISLQSVITLITQLSYFAIEEEVIMMLAPKSPIINEWLPKIIASKL